MKKSKNILFKTKAEWIMLFVLAYTISMIFSPIAEHIYTTTDWSQFTISNIAERYKEGQEKIQEKGTVSSTEKENSKNK